MPVELRQLRYFVAVAEEGNFTRAAGRVNLTQPNLSKQIAALEEALGVKLFERGGRGAHLTPFGEVALRYARETLNQVGALARAARDERAHDLTLRVAVPYPQLVAREELRRVLRVLRERFPDVQVEPLVRPMASVAADVLAGSAHLGVVGIAGEEVGAGAVAPELEVVPLARGSYFAALPEHHPLAEWSAVPLGALANEAFTRLDADEREPIIARVHEDCRHAGFTLRTTALTPTLLEAFSLVSVGSHVTFAAQVFLPELQLPGIAYRPVVEGLRGLALALIWRRDDRSPALRAFRTAHGWVAGSGVT